MTTEKTIALTRWTFVGKVMSLLFNMLSRLVITFLPRSKCLLISWLSSPSAVIFSSVQFSSVQLFSCVWLFVNPRTSACQASLSIINTWSSPKPTSIESVMPSNHLIFCCPLLLLPSIFPSIRVFSNESALSIRWPKYWSFSFSPSVLPMNIQDWFLLGWTGWITLWSKELSRVFSNTTVQKHQFFSAQLSL